MRKQILTAALFAGVLALMAAQPTQAQAQVPFRGVNNAFYVGPYGYYNSFARPNFFWNYNALGYNAGVFYPGAYRAALSPAMAARLWASPSYNIYSNHLVWGSWLSIRTPAYLGYSFNPYFGYSAFYRPSVYARLPLTPGYAGYVPPALILR